MAKRGKKGKRRGGKRKSKKSRVSKSRKHSAFLEIGGAVDAYKVAVQDDLGALLVKTPFDKGARAGLKTYASGGMRGGLGTNLRNNTKELQGYVLVKILQKVPIVKGPVNKAVSIVNSIGRQLGLPKNYKVF